MLDKIKDALMGAKDAVADKVDDVTTESHSDALGAAAFTDPAFGEESLDSVQGDEVVTETIDEPTEILTSDEEGFENPYEEKGYPATF